MAFPYNTTQNTQAIYRQSHQILCFLIICLFSPINIIAVMRFCFVYCLVHTQADPEFEAYDAVLSMYTRAST